MQKWEQAVLDDHEDKVANMMDRFIQLNHTKPLLPIVAPQVGLDTTHTPTIVEQIRNQTKRLESIEAKLKSSQETLKQPVARSYPNISLLRWRQIGVNHLESRLPDLMNTILLMEGVVDPLLERGSNIKVAIFDTGVRIKQMNTQPSLTSPSENTGIRLPKVIVPTFDSNIMNCNMFWQHFKISVDSKAQLMDMEKLAYLREALKDCPDRHIMEGLMQDADYYKEAIGCLQRCYDQLRMIHQAHVRAIY